MYIVVKREIRPKKLKFGLSEEAYLEMFPNKAIHEGFIKERNGQRIFFIERLIRDNPKAIHPVGSIIVLNANNIEDRSLMELALYYDYGLTKNEYEIIYD